jgi:hypothetical protein
MTIHSTIIVTWKCKQSRSSKIFLPFSIIDLLFVLVHWWAKNDKEKLPQTHYASIYIYKQKKEESNGRKRLRWLNFVDNILLPFPLFMAASSNHYYVHLFLHAPLHWIFFYLYISNVEMKEITISISL